MKKTLAFSCSLLCLIALVFRFFPSQVARAQTASSSTVSTLSAELTTQRLKERIDRVIEQHRDQVKGVVDQLTQKKRGFVAEIKRVSGQTVTISNSKGDQIFAINSSIIVTKEGKFATIDDLAVGDSVIALGNTTGQDFTLRRLAVFTLPLRPVLPDTTVGTLKSSSRTQLVITERKTQADLTFTLNKSTSYQDNQGKDAKPTDLQAGADYLVFSQSTKDQKIATIVRLLSASSTQAPAATPAAKTRNGQ